MKLSFKRFRLRFPESIREYIPMECPLCGNPPYDGSPNMFCRDCLAELKFTEPPFCPGCGGHLSGILELCPDCLTEPKRPWTKALALFRMEGTAEDVIRRYKYRNHPEYARALGQLASSKLKELNVKIDMIVPTPLHWTRYLWRGFNQAELLSIAISEHSGVPVRTALRRVKRTKQQARLKREERLKNIHKAFSAIDSTIVKNRAILLVDDVMTTGSTLSSAAKALLKAGASDVYVLVAARRQRN